MTKNVKPAVEPEFWAMIGPRVHHVNAENGRIYFVGERYGDKPGAPAVSIHERDEPQAMMALANHALPDDSPYKITRLHIGYLERIEDALHRAEVLGDGRMIIASEMAARLRAKLAALLPPETT